ncbi:hypothetical protein EYF80_012705 [Liparis tanakae]|uniref:Uncharacterized protein n=1 Tax=Liparis tanakae TaxID=230148 RepID=A0A4Z2IGY4_9TELE|nr:hypothetical protein EYF80_012705 [Liparis tanakae]
MYALALPVRSGLQSHHACSLASGHLSTWNSKIYCATGSEDGPTGHTGAPAVLEMCNNLEKLTRGYLSTHFWLRRFKLFKVADEGPSGASSADDNLSVCNSPLSVLLFA